MTRLGPGDPAPDLSLTNQDGEAVSLAALRGQDVIVYFFPRAFTPGCTTEVCDFRDRQPELDRAGHVVLGVSGDTTERLAEFHHEHRLAHDLLSDPDHEAARRWGAWGPKVIDGRPTTGPLRCTFTVDADGLLRTTQYEVAADGHVASLVEDLLGAHAQHPLHPSGPTPTKARG